MYLKGQNVQPVFEGWMRNADGSIDMVFGYLNRNYVEEPAIPIGPMNTFTPGPADRGQPGYFYPRRQSFVFRVRIPSDWGPKTELTWTLTHAGRTSTAVGTLAPSWEIDAGVISLNRGSGGVRTQRELVANLIPRIAADGPATVRGTIDRPVRLQVTASDDGVPGARPARSAAERGAAPDLPTTGVPSVGLDTHPRSQNMVKPTAAFETGLAVTWLHYRGAGRVQFDPPTTPIVGGSGVAVTAAHFGVSGTHVIRAVADDGIETAAADITVIIENTRVSEP
jgi:hypothetical protein